MNKDEKIQAILDVLDRPLREDVQKWLDIASGLKTYEEVKGSLRPELRSRTLELVKEWRNKQ